MAAASQGSLEKLTITACTVDRSSGKISPETGPADEFKVMLNPKGYEHTYTISYNESNAFGTTSSEAKYSGTKPDNINFSIWLDGTGVVRPEGPKPQRPLPPVKTQLQQLNNVVYKYDGEDHEPRVVRLLWGSMIFYGRLKTMSVSYKLFKPSGEPLRAEVTLAFTGFVSKEEESLKASRSSPDLTHIVEVKAGDTLPLLCNRIYKDSAYYLAVAEVNGIAHFRDIKPGQKLYFPPLS